MREISAVVTESPCPYVPKNVPVTIVLDKDDLPYMIHRQDNGAGTFLSNKWQQSNTVFNII
jgi:hypothetical protein